MYFYTWVPECWQTYKEPKPCRWNSPCWYYICPTALRRERPQLKSQFFQIRA